MKRTRRKGRVTLALVAERAGVSVTTVSVILSGRPQWLRQFHPETVERVRQTAQELGYHANLFATGLPGRGSALFALVLHDLEDGAEAIARLGAHEGAMLSGVIREATANARYPVAATFGSQPDEAGFREVMRILEGGVFGAIVRTPPPPFEKFLRSHMKHGHPVVVVFPADIHAWPHNAIDVDNDAVGYTAARLLADRGRRKWLLVEYENAHVPHKLRHAGFLRFAREAGIPVQRVRVPNCFDEADVCEHVSAHVARARSDALYGADYVLGVGALLGAVRLGLRPGEDIDLVGCDCSAWHNVHLPAITCVDVSWLEVGRLSVKELTKMQQAGTSRFDTILLPPRVVPGGTCPVTKKSAAPPS